jgi:hypothetical protein
MKADPHGTLDKALEKARNVRALLSAPQPSPTAVVLDERAHEWAPARVWLQREQGEGGSHTWCEDSVGDGDLIEEAEYVRVGAPSVEQTRALTEKEIIDVLPVDCSKVYGDFERGYNKALSHAREKIHAALTAARPASGETE